MPGPRRNPTVVIAIWILGTIALLEVILASVALAPRLAARARASGTPHQQAVIPSETPQAAPAAQAVQPPRQSEAPASPVTPPSVPPAAAVQSIIGGESTGRPFRQPPSDASMPQGASLQILNARLEGADDGARTLQIAIKARPGEPIDVSQVKVQVYFYDKENGETVPSKAQVTSRWTSAPVDWKDGEPELLEVRYLPDSADPDIVFEGYIVAVYYKGDRQDCRANPPRLQKMFEPKYFIAPDES
jgi:hypothetical protein